MKLKNKKKILLLPIITMLIVMSFFVLPIYNGKSAYSILTYKDEYYASLSETRQAVYDKLIVKSAKITERKTGTPNFNTPTGQSVDDGSIVSNLEGVDVSEKDKYVRTFDTVTYTIEVNADKNSNADIASDTILKGGAIKVKATIPKGPNGELYAIWEKDVWMQESSLSNNCTELYATYIIPESASLVGGSQEISFTLVTNGYAIELLTEDQLPKFEIWMEGNQPDNSSSTATSRIITDAPLYISGKEYLTFSLSSGNINYKDELNGVKGQYVNFRFMSYMKADDGIESQKGSAFPTTNTLLSDFELEYYYKDVSNGSWELITEETPNANGPLNGAEIVAINYSAIKNENAKPFPTSNNSNSSYIYAISYSNLYVYPHPGTTEGTLVDNALQLKVSDYLVNNTRDNALPYTHYGSPPTSFEFLNISIEMFFPFYDNGATDYDYKVIVKMKDVETSNSTTKVEIDKNTQFTNSSLSISFYEYTGDAISLNLYYYDYMRESSGQLSNKTSIGNDYGILYTYISGNDGLYYGGEKRLITWEAKYFVPTGTIGSNSGLNYATSATFKYGIYNSDPEKGLENLAEVNSSTEEDFTWYTSLKEAKENGAVTAILIDEPGWYGYGMFSNKYIYFKTPNDTTLIDDVAYFRQKVYLFKDEERTIVETFHADNTEDSFTPKVYEGETLISDDIPYYAGRGIKVYGQRAGNKIYVKTTDGEYVTNKREFDVSDGIIDFKLKPYFLPEGYLDNTINKVDLTITLKLPPYLNFIESSASIPPNFIRKASNGYTYVEWTLNDVMVGDELEDIYFYAEIDPFTENNSSNYVYAYITDGNNTNRGSYSYNDTIYYFNYYSYASYTTNISNLSGASTRKSIDKNYLEKNESTIISNSFYNISDSMLDNVKAVEELPHNGDLYESSFNGSYTLKILDLDENQHIYYTTSELEAAGIIKDENGNLSAQSVDFANNPHWIEVGVNDIVPSNVTFIGTTLGDLDYGAEIEFNYEFIPQNNEEYDKYAFRSFMTSDSLELPVSSYILEAQVGDRVISGTMFVDRNRNNIKDDGEVFEGFEVTLLDSNKNLVVTTTTDSTGYYEFKGLTKQEYYIQVKTSNNYEIVEKNAGLVSNSSVLNSDGITDVITNLNTEMRELVTEAKNMNVGIKHKEATLTINHYIEGTTTKLADSSTETLLWGDPYTTSPSIVDSNYELVETPTNANGTINGNIIVTYYYKLKTATLTVHHYIEGTTTSLVADEISTVTYTNTYKTSPSADILSNYEVTSTKGTLQGTVAGNIEVTYYYKLKSSTLTIKHLEYGTNKELASPETKTLKYTDEYETSISTRIPGNYEYYSKTDNYKGVVSSDTIEVIYYYQKKDSQLSTTVTLTAPNEITIKTQVVNYNIDYKANISDYHGSGTITLIVSLPYKIDENKSSLNGGTYNIENNTITWITTEKDINALDEQQNITITKNFSVVFSDLVSTDRTVNTSITSNIELDNNSRSAEDTEVTYIKISSKITIHHYIEGTTDKIVDDIETTNLVGETYISKAINKDGYIVKKEPENKNHIYQDEPQEIIYEYERIKFNIITKVDSGEGTIGGDEIVFYGDNSTEGNIVIKPSNGYQVSHIIVNGEEKNIEQCKNGCILNNFIDVQEDKEIVVVFEAIPNNPNTSSIITTFIITGLAILSVGAFILIRKFKPSIRKL